MGIFDKLFGTSKNNETTPKQTQEIKKEDISTPTNSREDKLQAINRVGKKFHVTAEGPKVCTASIRECKYGKHFDNITDASIYYDKWQETRMKYPVLQDEKILEPDNNLVCNIDDFKDKSWISNYDRCTPDSFAVVVNSNMDRFIRDKIMLPVKSDGSPDWHFMEAYIKERKNKQRVILRAYYNKRLENLTFCHKVVNDVNWKAFSLKSLFLFERGNQNNMAFCESGDIPLISAKKVDNGVKAFISDNGKKLFDGHILTLNNEALDINKSFIKKILSKFYPIFSKLVLNFYNSIGLNNIKLPEF